MKVKVRVRTNYIGSEDYEIFEMSDDSTEEMLNKAAFEVAMDLIEWSYEILEGNKND